MTSANMYHLCINMLEEKLSTATIWARNVYTDIGYVMKHTLQLTVKCLHAYVTGNMRFS
jgi:hypothetical protein